MVKLKNSKGKRGFISLKASFLVIYNILVVHVTTRKGAYE